MDKSLAEILVDPETREPLRLDVAKEDPEGRVIDGVLRTEDDRSYPVEEGLPRFVDAGRDDQAQTASSFGYKWKQRRAAESPELAEMGRRWKIDRYGFGDDESMRGFLSDHERVLDAGCGSGFSASVWLDEYEGRWVGMELSDAVRIAKERLDGPDRHFVQADVLRPPFRDGAFDLILSEGVLHHTLSTSRALAALVPLLDEGGRFVFYVYRKKGPLREHADDHVRSVVSEMPPEEAWEALKPLTRLGQTLADIDAEVEVPEDISYLGVEEGTYPVQRFVYWTFAKMFWNDDLSFEANHLINFDWYHPRYAHRHTEEEVRGWCQEHDLEIEWLNAERAGISVIAAKE